MSAVATADDELPEFGRDDDPEILTKLRNANKVLTDFIESIELEAAAAQKQVWDKHNGMVARFRSVVFEILAEAHEAGFTYDDIHRKLHHDDTGPKPL